MLISPWISILAGCVLGFLSGIGVGGGSLLMLWLTLVLNMPHPTARSINLLFFIPSALIASLFRHKQGTLDLRKLLPAIIAGCASAGFFSVIGKNADTDLIQKIFGILLILTGIRELFYKTAHQSQRRRKSR